MSDEPARSAMHIGEVAARTDLSLRSLRHWDEVGLLTPSGRSEGGFRLYTEDDVARILFVRRMKPLGFSLEEMRTAMDDLAAGDGDGDARSRLAHLRGEARERRTRLERQLAMADEFIAILDRELG